MIDVRRISQNKIHGTYVDPGYFWQSEFTVPIVCVLVNPWAKRHDAVVQSHDVVAWMSTNFNSSIIPGHENTGISNFLSCLCEFLRISSRAFPTRLRSWHPLTVAVRHVSLTILEATSSFMSQICVNYTFASTRRSPNPRKNPWSRGQRRQRKMVNRAKSISV